MLAARRCILRLWTQQMAESFAAADLNQLSQTGAEPCWRKARSGANAHLANSTDAWRAEGTCDGDELQHQDAQHRAAAHAHRFSPLESWLKTRSKP